MALGAVVAASLAVVGATATAAPTGIFAIFSNCPLAALKQVGGEATRCVFGRITGGEMALAGVRVPIASAIELEGGLIWTGNPENAKEFFLIPGANGQVLSNTELPIPAEGLTFTVEYAGSKTHPAIVNLINLAREMGTAIVLPVKIHLKGPRLGYECDIGSQANPVELHLTDATTSPNPPNKPIKGHLGVFETPEEYGLSMLRGSAVLVDNTFTVPVAEGCGGRLAPVLDGLIDSRFKLPSSDGHNTAIMSGVQFNMATSETVEASEKAP
ncbi:MAG TPA: hypothetical protein VNV42_15155 [Solirubrobacteraceae bacterium]|jgi:hypothetical protein|nr:hypothetical protein [Solirubrobacteraceae bacterium]